MKSLQETIDQVETELTEINAKIAKAERRKANALADLELDRDRSCAQYFKELSDADLSQYGSYGDCHLLDPDQQDKRMGVKKTAIGALNIPDEQRRALVIAMTPTANILYTDRDAF